MLRRKKLPRYKALCSEIMRTESVGDLSDLIVRARLQIAGFEIESSLWLDSHPEELMVLQTLATRLRELVEEGELDPDDEDPSSGEPDYDP
jgi:hypothetical protein